MGSLTKSNYCFPATFWKRSTYCGNKYLNKIPPIRTFRQKGRRHFRTHFFDLPLPRYGPTRKRLFPFHENKGNISIRFPAVIKDFPFAVRKYCPLSSWCMPLIAQGMERLSLSTAINTIEWLFPQYTFQNTSNKILLNYSDTTLILCRIWFPFTASSIIAMA